MLKEHLTPQDMRQTIVDLMNLPETEFLVASEVISDLKHQVADKAARRVQAAELLAEARRQAATLQQLPRAELFAQFRANLTDIRAHMQATGQATDDEAAWVKDD